MGTRIRDAAAGIPRPMIPAGERPTLRHLRDCNAGHGFKRFALCLGYKG
jgi:glucose-1-phosphate cytidylyltransferase